MEYLKNFFVSEEYTKQSEYINSNISYCNNSNSIFKKDEINKKLCNIYNLKPIDTTCIIGSDLKNDLEIFHPYDNISYDSTVYSKINLTTTDGGALFLSDILDTPQYSITLLNERQSCINKLEYTSSTESNYDVTQLKSYENDVVWFFSQKESVVEQLLDIIFFTFSKVCIFSPGFILSGLYPIKKSLLYKSFEFFSKIGINLSSMVPG